MNSAAEPTTFHSFVQYYIDTMLTVYVYAYAKYIYIALSPYLVNVWSNKSESVNSTATLLLTQA